MSKHNYFVIFFKKINLSVDNLLKKYLNKLHLSNISSVASSNKVFLTFVAVIILFLSYLSIPHTYNKLEIRKELENQLFDKFSLNFIFSKDFNYKFFPRPHFTIENLSLFNDTIQISNIKKLRIFVSLDNLFSLENIIIKDIILEKTNFNLDKKNYNFFIKLLDNDFSANSFSIRNSNIFFNDSEQEVLFINKIIDMKYYYDPKELKNIVDSENEIFNIPYSFKSYINKKDKKIYSKLNFNFLKLQIENELDFNDNQKKGYTNFVFNKNKSKIFYEWNKNLFVFKYFDKLVDTNFVYEGRMNFNPFYSVFKGDIDKIDLSNFFRYDSLSIQFLKSELLNNKNLNIDLNIKAKRIKQYRSFIDVFLNFKIQEGLIDIDNTNLSWSNNVDFKISDSLLYINNNQLILDGKLLINVKNDNEIFKFLQMSKNSRPELNKIELNFNYNFDQQIMNFDNIMINDQNSEKVNEVINKIILKKNKLQNKIYFKGLMKAAIVAYAG